VYSVSEKNHRQYNDHKNKDKGTSSWFGCFRFLFSEAIQPCSINHVDHAYAMDMRRSLQRGNLLII